MRGLYRLFEFLSVLKMQPAPHRIPEPPFGKQGNERDDDDPADGKDDGRPGRGKRFAEVAVDKQLDTDAEDGRFRKNVKGCSDDGNGQFPNAESEYLRQQSRQCYNRHGELPEPPV